MRRRQTWWQRNGAVVMEAVTDATVMMGAVMLAARIVLGT